MRAFHRYTSSLPETIRLNDTSVENAGRGKMKEIWSTVWINPIASLSVVSLAARFKALSRRKNPALALVVRQP